MDIGQQIMAFIANPNVAYLALIVGLLMLVVGYFSPVPPRAQADAR